MVFCVNQKMAMMENGLYYKTSSHVCAQYRNPPERDIFFLSTFVYLPFFIFAFINYYMFVCHIRQVFLNYLYKLTSDVRVPVCITICV